MRAVLTRVKSASVTVDGKTIGQIGQGFLILLGITHEDTEAQAVKLADKLVGLRIFEDEDEKMNMSILDVDGEVLAISQFTLCADIKKGNRPSFTTAAKPDYANELYEFFMEQLKVNGIKKVEHGSFGADMKVEIHNDGPVTIIMDTTIWNKRD